MISQQTFWFDRDQQRRRSKMLRRVWRQIISNQRKQTRTKRMRWKVMTWVVTERRAMRCERANGFSVITNLKKTQKRRSRWNRPSTNRKRDTNTTLVCRRRRRRNRKRRTGKQAGEPHGPRDRLSIAIRQCTSARVFVFCCKQRRDRFSIANQDSKQKKTFYRQETTANRSAGFTNFKFCSWII